MSYCVLEDIYGAMEESDVIGYTDDAGTNTVDETRTTQAIDGAGALIDAYLAKRYTVPLARSGPGRQTEKIRGCHSPAGKDCRGQGPGSRSCPIHRKKLGRGL